MSESTISPSIDRIETLDGVRYHLRTSGAQSSSGAMLLAVFLRFPVVAAVLAVWFIWRNFQQIPIPLAVISGLFVLQMLFLARLPWLLLRRSLWQQLIASFGRGEIELARDRLFLGNRVGVLRSGTSRPIGELRRIVIYVYPELAQLEPSHDAPPPSERAALGVETPDKNPWLLVDGLSKSETLLLADDLHRQIELASKRFASSTNIPPPVVIETEQCVLYPPVEPSFYQRRKPLWLTVHFAGAIGLAAITMAAVRIGAWQDSSTKVSILIGWLLEFLILTATVYLTTRNPAAEPNPLT